MDLIVDANILFAALITEGLTSELLFREDFQLHAPDYLFYEFEEYRVYLMKKTRRSNDDFDELLEVLRRRIILVPIEEIQPYVEEAIKISPDVKDVPYIALALKLHIPIWSNDKSLKNGQNSVLVYNTGEIRHLII